VVLLLVTILNANSDQFASRSGHMSCTITITMLYLTWGLRLANQLVYR